MKRTLLNKEKKYGDIFLLIAVVLLSLIGVVFIYSASNYSALATYKDSFYFVKKQLLGIIIGILVMIITAEIPYEKYRKFSIYIGILALVLLGLVFTPLGVENYGAKRWIGFGAFTIQPSEIAKFSFILFSASYISKKPERIRSFVGILPILLYGASICLLIIIEPNMSITMCIMLLMIFILFSAGMKIKHFLLILIPAVVLGVVLIIIEPYRLNRLSAFINPWASPKGEGYQLIQSLYAIGSGGWFGVGLFNSRQKFAFLPFSESDFILSVIAEEIGFVGITIIFILLSFIIFRGILIARNADSVFGYIMAIGITLIFGLQVLINAAVVTGSIPPTGLPLPLVSSGNTAIIIFFAEFGILYNISKPKENKEIISKNIKKK